MNSDFVELEIELSGIWCLKHISKLCDQKAQQLAIGQKAGSYTNVPKLVQFVHITKCGNYCCRIVIVVIVVVVTKPRHLVSV